MFQACLACFNFSKEKGQIKIQIPCQEIKEIDGHGYCGIISYIEKETWLLEIPGLNIFFGEIIGEIIGESQQ